MPSASFSSAFRYQSPAGFWSVALAVYPPPAWDTCVTGRPHADDAIWRRTDSTVTISRFEVMDGSSCHPAGSIALMRRSAYESSFSARANSSGLSGLHAAWRSHAVANGLSGSNSLPWRTTP